MKIAVSIPDALFERAEALARRLGVSRSHVYQEALAEYVARRDRDAVTASINAVIDEIGDDVDEAILEAGRRILRESEW